MPQNFCPNCGAQQNPGTAFCASCGAPTALQAPQRPGNRKSRRGLITIVSIVCAVLVLGAAAFFIINHFRSAEESSVSKEKEEDEEELSAKEYIKRGDAFLDDGDYEEAVDDFSAAIKLDKKLFDAYVGRGDAYFELEKYSKAIKDYEQALELDDNDEVLKKLETARLVDGRDTSATTASASASAAPATPAQPSDSASQVVKIGVYEPASGDNGVGGRQETLGIMYANSLTPTVEIGGETYKVELVVVDNESSTDKAVYAADALIASGVSVVLGSYGSGVSIAASDVFGYAGIPVIGVTCTNPQVTQGNDHYFRICYLDPFQGVILANLAADTFNAKKAYILAKLGDDYSVGLASYFREAFEKLGGEIIFEIFPEGTSDYSSYITNAKNVGADVFFAPTSNEAAGVIIEQLAVLGWDKPIISGDTWDSSVITYAANGKDVDIYVTTFYQEGGAPEFDAGFKAWVNGNQINLANNNGSDMISAVSAMGFDAYHVALEALQDAGATDPLAINQALWNVRYDGVTGYIAFDEIGDAIRNDSIVKKVNTETGEWEFVGIQSIR